jgi:hypothetical protein
MSTARNSSTRPTAESETPKAKAARLLAATVKVRVPRIGNDGKPVMLRDGPQKAQFDVIERALTEADIFAVSERDGRLGVVTVDGQKHEVRLP